MPLSQGKTDKYHSQVNTGPSQADGGPSQAGEGPCQAKQGLEIVWKWLILNSKCAPLGQRYVLGRSGGERMTPWPIPLDPPLHESDYHPNARILMVMLGRHRRAYQIAESYGGGLKLRYSRQRNS